MSYGIITEAKSWEFIEYHMAKEDCDFPGTTRHAQDNTASNYISWARSCILCFTTSGLDGCQIGWLALTRFELMIDRDIFPINQTTCSETACT